MPSNSPRNWLRKIPRPIQLIVPDGTWRQARKIHSRHHELKAIPRVKISTPNDSTYQLRAQSRREGMATLLAIAFALGIIEGEVVAAQLMQLYQARVARTLKARGLLPKHSEWELPALVNSKYPVEISQRV